MGGYKGLYVAGRGQRERLFWAMMLAPAVVWPCTFVAGLRNIHRGN
jgi:hypothetical protein